MKYNEITDLASEIFCAIEHGECFCEGEDRQYLIDMIDKLKNAVIEYQEN